ncbi:MAG: YigZ family protein [Clostridiales bacterium]|nr:YigZ family protein [Clostridiales bacterium]
MPYPAEGCRIVYTGGQDEIIEKKSRFIATVRPVATEEEAAIFIAQQKKTYWDARHNCSAFVIGEHQELTRCSDDGEPAQTAGRPILDVLLREDIHNAAVVVTRYFGGVLLGTGGLVRAYQKATQAGLAASTILTKLDGQELSVTIDYSAWGKLQYLFAQEDLAILDTVYASDVRATLLIPLSQKQAIEKLITNQTSGAARLTWGAPISYALNNKEIILL